MTLPLQVPLYADDLTAAGIEGWPFAVAGKVSFGELDPLNHVNNTAYLRWFESIRVDYAQAWGIRDYAAGEGPRLVVRSLDCHYRKEMHLGERYVVTCRTTAFRRTSYTQEYAVLAPDLRATGSAVVVMLAPDGSGRHPLPEALIQRFREVDGAILEQA